MASDQSVPILKSFRILGLHGYKDVILDFNGPSRIVIAENGMGKTTILMALNAFLQGDVSKLRNIQFSSIECDLETSGETLVLKREFLPEISEASATNDLWISRVSATVMWPSYNESSLTAR